MSPTYYIVVLVQLIRVEISVTAQRACKRQINRWTQTSDSRERNYRVPSHFSSSQIFLKFYMDFFFFAWDLMVTPPILLLCWVIKIHLALEETNLGFSLTALYCEISTLRSKRWKVDKTIKQDLLCFLLQLKSIPTYM